MKITVECPAKIVHKEIIEAVESLADYRFKYCGEDPYVRMNVNFEVDAEDKDAIVYYVKTNLKKFPVARKATFRVIPYGEIGYIAKY